MTSYQQLKKIFTRISHLQYAQRILMWDEAVMMPEGAGQSRADAMGTLNRLTQKMLITKKNKSLLDAAKTESHLDAWDVANLKWMEKRYLNATCIPLPLVEEMTKVSMGCEQAWRKLRAQNNWKAFLPYLEASFKLVKEVAERKSQVLQLSPYDALLDDYAPGFNQKSIDDIFSGLKKSLPDLLQQIMQKQINHTTQPLVGPFSIEKQKMLGLTVMKAMQFDFNQGRLDVSHHPFCGGDSEDVRITTRYTDNDFLGSLMGVCHETGHGLYEQGLPRAWVTQPVGKVDSMAMHESQSLLVEMEVCRSLSFFQYLVPLIEEKWGKQAAVSPENLHQIMTTVKPSLIRVDADEVTYPMHIILRYEIEKALFSGEITIKDLPAWWNELMMTYLGISTLGDDKDGAMQDVHWPSGAFGYFPAYTLGRLIAAQFFETFIELHPGFFDELKQGHFGTLRSWLKSNIHECASSLSTHDMLMKVTGKPLSSDYFVNRIKSRYL